MTDKLEPLKPITQKQQDEFDRRRETASVMQHKCVSCGAWYETAKRNAAFQEVFTCDCGRPMTFTVPALDTRSIAFDISDPDQVLDTGMKVREALASACYWWNKTGRRMMKNHDARSAAEKVSLDPGSDNFIPSGIVNGEPWDHLSQRERLIIVKHWHHFYVRNPQTL